MNYEMFMGCLVYTADFVLDTKKSIHITAFQRIKFYSLSLAIKLTNQRQRGSASAAVSAVRSGMGNGKI
jgi:hypothetical protein